MEECKSGACCGLHNHEADCHEGHEHACGCHCGPAHPPHECGPKCKHLEELVEHAKHELLKDKMKAVFEARIGKKLDKVAELAVGKFIECMLSKLTEEQDHKQFEEQLQDIYKN